MNSLLELREKIQQIYGEYAGIIEKVGRFVINILVFFMIQSKMGYMTSISKGIISLAIAVICTFLPPVCTCIAAAALILLQLSAVSPGVLLITLVVFALVFIFYLRFTANQSLVLVLAVVALALHLPVLVPVVAGLAGGPVTILPLICGTIVYYVLHSVSDFASEMGKDDGILTVLTDFAKAALQNREMIAAVIGIVLGVMLVYVIKRMSFPYSWQAAIVVGAVISAVVFIAGGSGFNSGSVAVSAILSVIVGLVIQFMIFNVDYSRTEQVQFEDDEYYYYVKAVPKNIAGARKKSGRR